MHDAYNALIALGKQIADRAMSWGSSGNLSVRLSPDEMLITASGASLGRLTRDDLVAVPVQGGFPSGVRRPSKEAPLHAAAYRERPAAGCVLHASPFYSTLLGMTDVAVDDALFVEAMFCLDRLAALPYYHPGSEELFAAVERAIPHHDVLLLCNHGVLIVGRDTSEAFETLECLENACHMRLAADSAGLALRAVPPDMREAFLTLDNYRKHGDERKAAAHFGVIADDVTGSNDIGAKLVQGGLGATLYSYPWDAASLCANDAIILDTDGRIQGCEEAYRRAYQAAEQLSSMGATQFFAKTCSVFRGNIGAQFDGILDALGEDFAPVVLGFPQNGRTTVEGMHYVYGQRLELSPFKDDPLHPATTSDLGEIIRRQSPRKTHNVTLNDMRRGHSHVAHLIKAARSEGGYLIFDVQQEDDLRFIASMIYSEPVICGASAIAEHVARYFLPSRAHKRPVKSAKPSPFGTLIAAGSLTPQTRMQIDYLHSAGMPVLALNASALFGKEAGKRQSELVHEACTLLRAGRNVILYTAASPDDLMAVRAAGSEAGLSGAQTSKLVSQELANLCRATYRHLEVVRTVVMGGDTSGSFCTAMGIRGMDIGEEIEPGVPVCYPIDGFPRPIVLKSGSFGGEDFLNKALLALEKAESAIQKQ